MKKGLILSVFLMFTAAAINAVHADVPVFKGAVEKTYAQGKTDFEKTGLRSIGKISDSRIPSINTSVTAQTAASKLSGQALFKQLHYDTETDGVQSYDSARHFMYSKADNIEYNGKKGIETFYSQIFIAGTSGEGSAYRERGDMNDDGVVDKFINAEHIWPQSFFKKQRPMVSDLHHLRPTLETPNGRRSALPFGKVTSPQYSTSSGSKMGQGVFEPCDQVKGDIARSVLYFIVRYHNQNIKQGGFNREHFINNRIEMLLEWNRMDPPDAEEKRRNELIHQFQGNRNPFIDDYTLADKIGPQAFKL